MAEAGDAVHPAFECFTDGAFWLADSDRATLQHPERTA